MPLTATSFCLNIFYLEGFHYLVRNGDVGVFKLIVGLTYLFEGVLIVVWIRRQEARYSTP